MKFKQQILKTETA